MPYDFAMSWLGDCQHSKFDPEQSLFPSLRGFKECRGGGSRHNHGCRSALCDVMWMEKEEKMNVVPGCHKEDSIGRLSFKENLRQLMSLWQSKAKSIVYESCI